MLTEYGRNRINHRADPFERQRQDDEFVPIGQLRADHIATANAEREQTQRALLGELLQDRV